MVDKSGIYKIQSKVRPDRIYIGSALNIKKRKYEHLKKLKRNKHHSKKLQNHFNKYGEHDLKWSVELLCYPEYLILIEQTYLDSLNPFFNICKKAGSTYGIKGVWSKDTIKRFSEYRKANSRGEKNGFYGKHHSQESLAKMRGPKPGKQTPRPWFSEMYTGVKNPNAKLSQKQIDEILEKCKSQEHTYKELAGEYNVCADTIYRLNRIFNRGLSYKNKNYVCGSKGK